MAKFIGTKPNQIPLNQFLGNMAYQNKKSVNVEAIKAATYQETYATFTSTSNASTIDCSTGTVFSHTLTENTTVTFSNPPATGTAYGMSVEIVQDAGASGYTVTWPA